MLDMDWTNSKYRVAIATDPLPVAVAAAPMTLRTASMTIMARPLEVETLMRSAPWAFRCRSVADHLQSTGRGDDSYDSSARPIGDSSYGVSLLRLVVASSLWLLTDCRPQARSVPTPTVRLVEALAVTIMMYVSLLRAIVSGGTIKHGWHVAPTCYDCTGG